MTVHGQAKLSCVASSWRPDSTSEMACRSCAGIGVARSAAAVAAAQMVWSSYETSGDALSPARAAVDAAIRSEEHTSELQSLMRISYDVFCFKKNKNTPSIYN